MGKISASHIFIKELITEIYKELIQSKGKKQQQQQQKHWLKSGQRIWIDIFPKTYRWSTGTWEDVQHRYQGSADQSHNEIPPHTAQMAILKMTRNNQCSGEYREKGAIVNWWEDCKLVQSLWKTAWRLPKNMKARDMCGETNIIKFG